MENTERIENLSRLFSFIIANSDDLPHCIGEGFRRFLGYRAAYIVYTRGESGKYLPAAYFGDKVYAQWYEVFAAKYSQNDIFVRHMGDMLQISGMEKKYVWRIQDFQPLEEFHKTNCYTHGLAVHGVGYRAWITFPQSWDRQQHTIAVFKSFASGDFDDEEFRLLTQVGCFLETAMQTYQDRVEGSLFRALLFKFGIAAQENACVLNCLHRVIFQTESFDAMRQAALGNCAIWEVAQRLLDGREPSTLPPGKSYTSEICNPNAKFCIEVTPFWTNEDIIHKTQYLLLIKIFCEKAPEEAPAERAAPAIGLDNCYIRLIEHYGLTKREYDVLKLIVNGASTKSIAQSLFVSVSTVRTHIGNLFQKLDAHNRAELIARLISMSRGNDV